MNSQSNDLYNQKDFSDVLTHIQQTRQKIFAHVNTALIDLYWHIGKIISHKISTEAWGKGVVSQLSLYIAEQDPELKGFSDNNLWRMKQFILELGQDFIFVGEEYRLQVGNQDFFIDLLFFHRGLSALVAFELIIGKFSPEHLGQLNFYLEALDRDVKKTHENPSIGVLLCRDKDEEVVKYALSRNLSPTMIAQYELQLPDKKLIQTKLHELSENEYSGLNE